MTDESEQRINRLKQPWIVALLIAAGVMFVVDLWLGVNSFDDALHIGPFGMTWLWTPGSTAVYAVILYYIMVLISGDSLDGLAR